MHAEKIFLSGNEENYELIICHMKRNGNETGIQVNGVRSMMFIYRQLHDRLCQFSTTTRWVRRALKQSGFPSSDLHDTHLRCGNRQQGRSSVCETHVRTSEQVAR